MLIGLRRSGNFSLRKDLIRKGRNHALQALFPLRRRLLPARILLREFRSLGLPPPLFPTLQVGRMRGGGCLRVHLVLCLGRLPPHPARPRSSERGGSVCGRSSVARERASASSAPSGAGEMGVARSQRTPLGRAASSVASPRSSPHARRRGELREASEDRSRVVSSCGSQSSDRGARKDKRARSRSDSSRERGRRSRPRSSSRSRSRGRERRRRLSSRSLSSHERLRRVRSRSSYRSRSRRVRSRSLRGRSRSSDRYRSLLNWPRSSD